MGKLKDRRLAAYNSTYPKGGVSCFNDRFVVARTFVLLTNICGESPALRVAAKRCRQCGSTHGTVNNKIDEWEFLKETDESTPKDLTGT